MGVLHEPHGCSLQIIQALLQALCVDDQIFVRAVFFAEIADLLEERHDGPTAIETKLAANEIERLDAVGTLVNHGNAGVAHILAHAPFFDIAVTAIDLLSGNCVVEALVGQYTLDDRGDEAEQVRLQPGVPPRRSNDVQCPIAAQSTAGRRGRLRYRRGSSTANDGYRGER